MILTELVDRMGLTPLTESIGSVPEIEAGYVGDLLSHVLASATPNCLWITIQRHENVVAVAQVAGLTGVVFAEGVRPEAKVVERAQNAGIALFSSPDSSFELAGRLHRLLHPERS